MFQGHGGSGDWEQPCLEGWQGRLRSSKWTLPPPHLPYPQSLTPGPFTDPDSFLKSARLQRLPSSSSEMGSQDGSPLRETRKDPFSAAAAECSCRQDGLTVIVTACLTFATGVTVALIMQIYFGDPQVRNCLRRSWELGNG